MRPDPKYKVGQRIRWSVNGYSGEGTILGMTFVDRRLERPGELARHPELDKEWPRGRWVCRFGPGFGDMVAEEDICDIIA